MMRPTEPFFFDFFCFSSCIVPPPVVQCPQLQDLEDLSMVANQMRSFYFYYYYFFT